VNHLQAGRSADEVVAAVGQLGLTAPRQLIDWWGWHDGVSAGGWIGGGAQMLSLDVAMRTYDSQREFALAMGTAEKMDPDLFWPSWCVPLFSSGAGDLWAIDCSEGPERGYIRFLPAANVADNYGSPIAASLDALLGELCRVYAAEAVRYVPEFDHYDDSEALGQWMWTENVQPAPKRAGFA
jgi:cell wall assembly regulator SMI1